MKQQQFETHRQASWDRFRAELDALEARGRRANAARRATDPEFPALYRAVCGDYALARSRGYSPGLMTDLHDLVRRGYRALYRRRVRPLHAAWRFMTLDFPATLRRHALLFWLAMGLLFVPMAAIGIASYLDSEVIYSLMDQSQIGDVEFAYDPARAKPGRDSDREADTDLAMFGFYIMNNIGLGFRSFASGVLFGVGSVFFLVFNGLYIGAIAGHLTRIEFGGTFWPFVSGHGPYELTAIAVSGAAGLLIGKALLAPGNRTRAAALRENARDAVVLVGGAAVMLLFAAVVEAFWSAGPVPAPVKYGVGAVGWLVVALYLTLAGREVKLGS